MHACDLASYVCIRTFSSNKTLCTHADRLVPISSWIHLERDDGSNYHITRDECSKSISICLTTHTLLTQQLVYAVRRPRSRIQIHGDLEAGIRRVVPTELATVAEVSKSAQLSLPLDLQ
jgi:hypothetical protein